MKKRIFIDGSSGTTGLRIFDRLAAREDVTVHTLPDALRHSEQARREALCAADIAFLCLPDDAARQAAQWAQDAPTVLIDTSTAHRTAPGWVYAFPEWSPQQPGRIAEAKRIAVPGCHASGFIALIAPLVQAGLLSPDALLSCHSITGYSGGGKSMIDAYTRPSLPPKMSAPRLYGISQQHKHLPEMQTYTGLTNAPVFCPVVAPFYSGMLVTVGLLPAQLEAGASRQDIIDLYKARYPGPVVRFAHAIDENGFVAANALSGTDGMEIAVLGNDARMVLAARYDNLGKGACGAALQALNLVLGLPQTAHLIL